MYESQPSWNPLRVSLVRREARVSMLRQEVLQAKTILNAIAKATISLIRQKEKKHYLNAIGQNQDLNLMLNTLRNFKSKLLQQTKLGSRV